MKILPLLVCLVVAAALGGCKNHCICPPVEGTIIDAVTGSPIPAARVTIHYYNSKRMNRTDSMGHFAFDDPEYQMLLTGHLDRVWGFSLCVEAEGYRPLNSPKIPLEMSALPRYPLPHEIQPMQFWPYRMVYTGKTVVIDPIPLQQADAPQSRRPP